MQVVAAFNPFAGLMPASRPVLVAAGSSSASGYCPEPGSMRAKVLYLYESKGMPLTARDVAEHLKIAHLRATQYVQVLVAQGCLERCEEKRQLLIPVDCCYVLFGVSPNADVSKCRPNSNTRRIYTFLKERESPMSAREISSALEIAENRVHGILQNMTAIFEKQGTRVERISRKVKELAYQIKKVKKI